MKTLLKLVTSLALFLLINSNAYSLEKVKLMEVISEPEGNLKRTVYIEINDNKKIQSLEIYIDDKLEVKATAEQIKKGEVLLTRVAGFDSVFLDCQKCFEDKGVLTLRYLVNGAAQKFENTEIEIKRMGANWAAILVDSKAKIDTLKFTAKKFMGVLIGIDQIIANPV